MKDIFRFLMTLAFGALILSPLPFILRATYLIHFMIMLFIYIAMAESWNLIGGYCGQIALYHASFFGLGAYSFAILLLNNVNPIIGIIFSGIVSSLFALATSPLLKLGKTYFAAVTLVSSEILKTVFINWKEAGGASGLVLPKYSGYSLVNNYFAALSLSLIILFVVFIIVRSRAGLALMCIRENETAAESIGISVFRFKIFALVISGLMAGLAGACYASYFLYILPHSIFSVAWTGVGAFSCLIGGRGTLLGPIIGSSIYLLVSEVFLGFGEISLLVIGLVIVAIVLFAPRGMLGVLEKYLYKYK